MNDENAEEHDEEDAVEDGEDDDDEDVEGVGEIMVACRSIMTLWEKFEDGDFFTFIF